MRAKEQEVVEGWKREGDVRGEGTSNIERTTSNVEGKRSRRRWRQGGAGEG
jgi:hypothetical protein